MLNLVLCIMILLLGLVASNKSKDSVPLIIGIAFGLFGVSHFMKILNLEGRFLNYLMIIRALAYLIVAFALARAAFRK